MRVITAQRPGVSGARIPDLLGRRILRIRLHGIVIHMQAATQLIATIPAGSVIVIPMTRVQRAGNQAHATEIRP
jgi:hypothetical protein